MKNTARTLLATLATFTITATSLHAQDGPVTIPGLEGGGEGTDPTVGEMSGAGGRLVLRVPYGTGVIVPPWMEKGGAPGSGGGSYTPPKAGFTPGYRRQSTLSGETTEEFGGTIEEGTGGFGGMGEEGFGRGMGKKALAKAEWAKKALAKAGKVWRDLARKEWVKGEWKGSAKAWKALAKAAMGADGKKALVKKDLAKKDLGRRIWRRRIWRRRIWRRWHGGRRIW